MTRRKDWPDLENCLVNNFKLGLFVWWDNKNLGSILFSTIARHECNFHCNHFGIQCKVFQLVIWMWEFQPIEREKQAIDREERSSQQFHINNIGRRLAIRAENRNVIHMRSSWQSYIQLAMGEDRFRQINANDFHGLTLDLVNGHSKCQLQGELAPL